MYFRGLWPCGNWCRKPQMTSSQGTDTLCSGKLFNNLFAAEPENTNRQNPPSPRPLLPLVIQRRAWSPKKGISFPFCLNPLSLKKNFFLRIQLYDLLAPPACNQGDVGFHWIIDWQLKNGEDFPNFVLLCCHSNEDELVRFLLRCIKVTETDWQLKVWLCVLHASFHTQNDWLHIKMTVAASIYARQSWHSEIGDWR